MKKLAVFLLLGCSVAVVPMARAASMESAEEMASNCKGVAEARSSGDSIEIPTTFAAGVCWGAFSGIQQAILIVPNSATKYEDRILNVCAPMDSTRTELIQIFMAYTKQHPEQLHKDYFFVVMSALRAAYPCSK
jgi:hypothetical protein